MTVTVYDSVDQLAQPDGDDQLAKVFPTARYLESAGQARGRLEPNEKKEARKLIAKFLRLSEQQRGRIHYTQHRPFDPSVYPDVGFRGDCSSFATQAFYYAWDILDGVPLQDPNGVVQYDGYGFTGTLLSTNHEHRIPMDRKFFVGDLAIYGSSMWNTKHVTVCRQNGVAASAIFSSHGSEAGPVPTRVRYRADLLGVYRPESLL